MSVLLYALRVLLFCALLFVIPMGCGLAVWQKNQRGTAVTFLYGVCAALTLFALVYLPVLFTTRVLSHITAAYLTAALALAVFGFLRFRRCGARLFRKPELGSRARALLLIAGVLVLMQAVRMAVCVSNMTGDDCFYLAETIEEVKTDLIWSTNAETGAAVSLWRNFQYSLSPWPVLWAVFSSLFNIHPAILMHTILPAPITLLFYLVLWLLFRYFFGGDVEKTLFALILSVFFVYALSSELAVKYFWISFLPWYGKAVSSCILCPALLFFLLSACGEDDAGIRRRLWFGVFFAAAAACTSAATGTVLALVMLVCWGLALMIRRRQPSLIWKLALCASPCAAQLAAMYLF